MKKSADAFRKRARRAEELAKTSATASALLSFAAGLYDAQSVVAYRIADLSGELARDASALLSASRELIAFMAKHGPPSLAGIELDAARLLSHVRERRTADHPEGFVARALLRPYLETLAVHDRSCGPPWIAARRSEPGSDGASRWLSCAWCGAEQQVNRILCPACGETDPSKLPAFQSDAFSAVRIEACERCHRYVKSIDLTLDARPIPEVDDLLSVSLDLWAREQGFLRIEPGLAGL